MDTWDDKADRAETNQTSLLVSMQLLGSVRPG
jgi:hypothetical protein